MSFKYLRIMFAITLLSMPVSAIAREGEKTGWEVNNPDFSSQPRSASINVTEGTWVSLDVSPDGSTIVFDLLGDIYSLPIEGGKATAITQGMAWDIQPRFSPDGSQIAFISDRDGGDNVWLQDLDSGDSRQLTFESFRLLNNPSWSPDGQYIAARKHFTTSRSLGTGEIWLYHVDGNRNQKGQQVVARPNETFQKEQGEPTFSADGKSIYFSRDVGPGTRLSITRTVTRNYSKYAGLTWTMAASIPWPAGPAVPRDRLPLLMVSNLPMSNACARARDCSSWTWPLVKKA